MSGAEKGKPVVAQGEDALRTAGAVKDAPASPATPLPWKVWRSADNHIGIINESDAYVCDCGIEDESKGDAAFIVTAVNAHDAMKEALAELEAANEALAARRSQRTYQLMLAEDCQDQLLRLDRARAKARAALALART